MIPHQGSIALPLADPGHLKIKVFSLFVLEKAIILPTKSFDKLCEDSRITLNETPIPSRHSEPYHVQDTSPANGRVLLKRTKVPDQNCLQAHQEICNNVDKVSDN